LLSSGATPKLGRGPARITGPHIRRPVQHRRQINAESTHGEDYVMPPRFATDNRRVAKKPGTADSKAECRG
jgi:hypothetical protein